MPYAKRWSTPVMPQVAEETMVIGFWVRARIPEETAPRLCEKHVTMLHLLDESEDRRRTAPTTPPPFQPSRKVQFNREMLGQMPVIPAQQPLGPIPNGSTVTAPPPPAIAEPGDLASFVVPKVVEVVETSPTVPALPIMITVIAPEPVAEEADRQEQLFPCAICGKAVKPGEVHACR